MTQPDAPRSIFISYAHADNEGTNPKKRWLDRFLKFLTPFVGQDGYTVSSDQDIRVGDNWHEQLQFQLDGAQAAVLLVSPDFLASKYIANSELPVLFKKSAEAGLRIFPIIISPCSYQRTKFKYPDPNAGPSELLLSSIQAANPPSKTLVEMNEGEQNRVLKKVAEQLDDLLAGSSQPRVVRIPPPLVLIEGDAPPPIRPLLRDLELAMRDGDLRDSELAANVLAVLQNERQLKLAERFDSRWLIAGILASDNYFSPISLSAGQRDWQRDFAKTATPILVGVAWSLQRSADAQAVVIRLCNVLAERLRLKIIWPSGPDESNDLKNSIYRACLDAGELESDDVLVELQGLTVVGPE